MKRKYWHFDYKIHKRQHQLHTACSSFSKTLFSKEILDRRLRQHIFVTWPTWVRWDSRWCGDHGKGSTAWGHSWSSDSRGGNGRGSGQSKGGGLESQNMPTRGSQGGRGASEAPGTTINAVQKSTAYRLNAYSSCTPTPTFTTWLRLPMLRYLPPWQKPSSLPRETNGCLSSGKLHIQCHLFYKVVPGSLCPASDFVKPFAFPSHSPCLWYLFMCPSPRAKFLQGRQHVSRANVAPSGYSVYTG